MPAGFTTYEGYRAFLERNGNSVWMVAELLRGYFPDDPRAIAPEKAVRLAEAAARKAVQAPAPATRRKPVNRRATREGVEQLTFDIPATTPVTTTHTAGGEA